MLDFIGLEKIGWENVLSREELELDVKKIAIEKNYEIILPADFGQNILSEGDRIEIVHFIGGG